MINRKVQMTRILAMFFIVLCHLCGYFGLNAFRQLFNVGVPIFFFMSGFLYADKEINSVKKFAINRWKKMCIPMYIFIFSFVVLEYILFKNDTLWGASVLYLLNLQGVSWLFLKSPIDLSPIEGMGPLWFLTMIMFCYILLVMLKKWENKNGDAFYNKHKNLIIVLLVIIDLLCLLLFEVQLAYILTFYLGYIEGKVKNVLTKKRYIFGTAFMVFAILARLLSRNYIDDTTLYTYGIAVLSQIVLAIWIYHTVCVMCEWNKICEEHIVLGSLMDKLDGLSLYIYMCHNIVLYGRINVSNISGNSIVQIIVFIVAVVIIACALKKATEWTIAKLSHSRNFS